MITAEQFVLTNKDTSFIKAYSDGIAKLKADFKQSVKDKVNLLSARIQIIQNADKVRTSNNLSALQFALTNYHLTVITYTNKANQTTGRILEPFAVVSTHENWVLLAFCRLRNEFRFFRLERIIKLEVLPEKFSPHQMTLQDYFQQYY